MIDPAYAHTISKQNLQRLHRPLEVYLATGKALSEFQNDDYQEWDIRCFTITAPKKQLFRVIDHRCEEMITLGLLQVTKYIKFSSQGSQSFDGKGSHARQF